MSKKSKYARVNGWDDSEGFLTSNQVELLKKDEIANQESESEKHTSTDEYLDFVYENSTRIITSEKNKSAKVIESKDSDNEIAKLKGESDER